MNLSARSVGDIIIPTTITTAELAAVLRVKPQTVRAGFCRDGHYVGLRPLKLPSRRLYWNATEVLVLLSGTGVQ